MSSCCCGTRGTSIPLDEDMDPKYVFEREYWQIHGRNLRDEEYRQGPFVADVNPFDDCTRQNVESACRRQYVQAVAISKMNEDEFVCGVMKHFDKEKANFDEERMHRQLRILNTIPTDLIKAYLSMKQNE